MKKSDIRIGGKYAAKISGQIVAIRIDHENPYGPGWIGVNMTTGRKVRIRSASKLHHEIVSEVKPSTAGQVVEQVPPAPITQPAAKFALGQVVGTPGCLEAIEAAKQSPAEFLNRHHRGDWGLCGTEDWQSNEDALHDEARIFSVYETRLGVRLWVITEADRSSTCLLLPSEY